MESIPKLAARVFAHMHIPRGVLRPRCGVGLDYAQGYGMTAHKWKPADKVL